MQGDGAWRVGKPYIWREGAIRMAAINWPMTMSSPWPKILFENENPQVIVDTFHALTIDESDAASFSTALLLWNLLTGAMDSRVGTQ